MEELKPDEWPWGRLVVILCSEKNSWTASWSGTWWGKKTFERSVSIYVCGTYLQWAEDNWCNYTVALSIRLLFVPKPSQVCIYDKSHSSHPWCCGTVGWLALCAVTLSPCTSVGHITLSLQLVITCTMRQYNILRSTVSSLTSFQRAQYPLEPSCALRYTGRPFMCPMATFCYL